MATPIVTGAPAVISRFGRRAKRAARAAAAGGQQVGAAAGTESGVAFSTVAPTEASLKAQKTAIPATAGPASTAPSLLDVARGGDSDATQAAIKAKALALGEKRRAEAAAGPASTQVAGGTLPLDTSEGDAPPPASTKQTQGNVVGQVQEVKKDVVADVGQVTETAPVVVPATPGPASSGFQPPPPGETAEQGKARRAANLQDLQRRVALRGGFGARARKTAEQEVGRETAAAEATAARTAEQQRVEAESARQLALVTAQTGSKEKIAEGEVTSKEKIAGAAIESTEKIAKGKQDTLKEIAKLEKEAAEATTQAGREAAQNKADTLRKETERKEKRADQKDIAKGRAAGRVAAGQNIRTRLTRTQRNIETLERRKNKLQDDDPKGTQDEQGDIQSRINTLRKQQRKDTEELESATAAPQEFSDEAAAQAAAAAGKVKDGEEIIIGGVRIVAKAG